MESEPSLLVDNNVSLEIESSDAQQPTTKLRKKKSMVWNHFTAMATETPGITKALCNHCNKAYAYITGDKTSGTSHLKRHIELGSCTMLTQVKQIKDESTVAVSKKRQRSPAYVPVDYGLCNREMAKMMIMHDYPLDMVEHPGFVGFVKSLRPQFSMASYDIVQSDCVAVFLSRKQELLDFIGDIPGAVNLTVDLWSSKQSVGYAFVTGHFIDKHWNLSHRLLNVAAVASPDSDSALYKPVADCISDWNLEGKISSIAVSQSLVNKTCVDSLRGFLSVRNQHVLNGQLLMGKCCARVLSSMAQDALAAEQFQAPIKKIRDSIKFVKTNDACADRFGELKGQFPALSSSKDPLIDNQTRWDTSYDMLLAACEHRPVFSSLETCLPDYKISISPEEWRKIESLCSCLKVLFEVGNVLTRPNHLTAKDLYYGMTILQKELSNVAMDEDPDVRHLANSLWEKFDLYWRGCFLVLGVTVVMDPRFKMQVIELDFTQSYGEDAESWIKTVADALHDLYLNYSEHNLLGAYVDHGFSEAEVAQEAHFHQDLPQDANSGNVQSQGDEISSLVEQTTESHPIAEEDGQELGAGSLAEETTLTESHQHGSPPNVEKENVECVWEGATEDSQMTEADQQLGADTGIVQSQGDEISQVEQTTESHPIAEEEGQKLGADSVAEETTHTGSHQHESQPRLEKENVETVWEGVTEDSQMTEADQQLGDDSQGHVVEEEEHPLLTGDVLLGEGSTLVTIGDTLSDFEFYISDMKTELDQYLEEPLIERSEDFNVLNWWKVNTTKYPTLSKMAIDLLSVPFSTVSPDSVFDTEVKQMDNYKTSLSPVILEALLCTKNWLQNQPL